MCIESIPLGHARSALQQSHVASVDEVNERHHSKPHKAEAHQGSGIPPHHLTGLQGTAVFLIHRIIF